MQQVLAEQSCRNNRTDSNTLVFVGYNGSLLSFPLLQDRSPCIQLHVFTYLFVHKKQTSSVHS